MDGRSATILGATGLVGGHLLELLLEDPRWTSVTTLGRRPLGRRHDKLQDVVVDFEALDDHAARFAADDVLCCLGTTMKQVGSKEAFRAVDERYPLTAARLARDQGAGGFLLVSAVDANPHSLFFYNRVKGEVEARLREHGPDRVHVVRPSLLLGQRGQPRPMERFAERLFNGLGFVLVGPLSKYRPVHGRTVARALVTLAAEGEAGFHTWEPDDLRRLGA
ncbi:MAG: NAD-dependent epimerase/dehydratase family protein [Alphaproteobacteria bacterium]|nr:NAD-dependent epimerase/dehydratase family protein [Alphaproteobacteria bacterium]